MSWRGLLLGSIGATAICSVTYFNDWVLRQTFLVGNHMPVSVYGGLLILLVFNGVLLRYRKQWSLRGGELALILGMMLAACCIPSSGLMRTFTTTLMLPHHYAKTEGGWQKNRLTDELTPPIMLADVTTAVGEGNIQKVDSDTVTISQPPGDLALGDVKIKVEDSDGYRQVRRLMTYDEEAGAYTLDAPWDMVPEEGAAYTLLANNEADTLNPFTLGNPEAPQVRWSAWSRTLLFWVPLIICFWTVMIGLSLVVHKQWAQHEQLPYPVAQVTHALFPDESGGASSIFKSRGFWIAASLVCLLYLNNYIQTYFPETWVEIPTRLDFAPLMRMLDIRGMAKWGYARPQFFFAVIAIAYFLSSDVSLSVGLSPLIYGFISAFLITVGIDITEGGSRSINYEGFFLFGAYLGIAMMTVYTGRYYYLGTIRRALGFKAKDDIPKYAIWGARFCAIGTLSFVLVAARTGLEWYVALFYFLGLIMMLLVMSRILAETGLFFIQTRFVLSSIVVGIMGPKSIGLDSCLILFLFSAVLAIDPREALMPYVVNSSQLLDKCKEKLGRATIATGVAALLGLAVAIPVTLHLQHKHGGGLADGFGGRYVPQFAYANTLRLKQRLEEQWDDVGKVLVQGEGVTAIQPTDWSLFVAAAIGITAAAGFSWLRLRFNWWPLHPVMFLVCASYGTVKFGPSFLIGWFIKLVVSKYGGTRVYQQLRPIMIGLIVGEIFGALIPVIIGYVIFWITGDPPNSFSVFPT